MHFSTIINWYRPDRFRDIKVESMGSKSYIWSIPHLVHINKGSQLSEQNPSIELNCLKEARLAHLLKLETPWPPDLWEHFVTPVWPTVVNSPPSATFSRKNTSCHSLYYRSGFIGTCNRTQRTNSVHLPPKYRVHLQPHGFKPTITH